MKIVLADDHPLIRSGVASVLALSGFTIAAFVEDGEAAIAAIARHRPDIVVLDVQMPKVDGIGVLRHMRGMDDATPVVLLTAGMKDEQLIEALRLEVKGIVFKDGAEDRLVECIERVAQGHRYLDKDLLDRALEISLNPSRDPLAGLAPREREIASHVAAGLRNREIAGIMGITEGTVKVYLNSVYSKLALRNRTALALLVNAQGKG